MILARIELTVSDSEKYQRTQHFIACQQNAGTIQDTCLTNPVSVGSFFVNAFAAGSNSWTNWGRRASILLAHGANMKRMAQMFRQRPKTTSWAHWHLTPKHLQLFHLISYFLLKLQLKFKIYIVLFGILSKQVIHVDVSLVMLVDMDFYSAGVDTL